MHEPVRICTAPSSATASPDCRGQVLVSGSYGGTYNAYHAGKLGLRGVVLNDAGVGLNDAGIDGLGYLDTVGLPAATADAGSCHIGDGEHMLAHGIISFVNAAAGRLGCEVGMSVRSCADRMRRGDPVQTALPPVEGGRRHDIEDLGSPPTVVCLDAAPLLEPKDTGAIVITGSHAALFRGKPDDVVKYDVHAIFFSDAGVGMDGAGVARLPVLDGRNIPAGAASCASASIGNSRSILRSGILSHVNATAAARGAHAGMTVVDAVTSLIRQWRPA